MANMTFKADLLPNSNYGYRLGSEDKRWAIPGVPETIIGTQVATTGSWTGTSQTIKALYNGLTIRYYLPYDGSGNATLNLTLADGTTTGAIACYFNNNNRLTTHFARGTIFELTYFSAGSITVQGTATAQDRWICSAQYDSNDVNRSTVTYPRMQTGAVGIGRYTLFMEASDGTYQSITSTFNSTGTSHVKNTTKFKLGRVYYSNRSSDIAANNSADTSNSWKDQQTNLIDLRYSTNCGQTLTARKSVYLVGTVDTDGYFTLADTWYTQTVPTSEDGKVYIYLGEVYDDTNPYRVAFEIENPIYWYKNGGFRLYGSGRGIANITRSGTTFTVTRDDGSTFNFTQQDNNTTYTLSGLGGVGTVSASGTAPLTLNASKSGTTVSITGSVATASTSSAGVTQYTAANLNTWLNQLTTGSSDPVDADWYISQYAGGGTTTTSFHRRPVSALYNYIKTKLAISNKNATLSYGGTSTIASIGGTDIKVTMPASDNTNNAVTQTATDSSNANYEILFSATADNTTRTEGARKTSGLIYNPSTRLLTNTGATNASGEYRAVRGSYGMWMGFGSGNANHGLYSQVKDGWMIYSDASGNVQVNGNASSATKAIQDESGNNIKATYASSFSISDHTITLKNKNGASLGTVTVPDNNTLNTAGSTDTSSKIFLIGATSQATNPQTYSDNQVYATNGQLDANKMRVAEHVTLQYNTTTSALDFIFA